MLFVMLVRYLRGFVRVRVRGMFVERFINVCSSRGVPIWNISRCGSDLECTMFASHFRRIHSFRRSCGVSVHIKYKRGMPFVMRRFRRRYGMMAGAALAVLILAAMPQFAWNISVNGNSRVDSQRILTALESIGVRVGCPLSAIDCDNMRQELILAVPELSWAAINIEGTFVEVDVREALDPGEVHDTDYCNVAARCDGLVVSIQVWGGEAVVKAGDAVCKGDTLVMGTREYSNGYTEFSHASASVIAETERQLTVEVPMRKTERLRTGKTQKKRVLRLFWLDVPLYLGSTQYDCDREACYIPLKIGGVELPIGMSEAVMYETKTVPLAYSAAEAEQLARQHLEADEKKQLSGAEILKRDIKISLSNDTVKLTADYICREDIAESVKLQLDEQ